MCLQCALLSTHSCRNALCFVWYAILSCLVGTLLTRPNGIAGIPTLVACWWFWFWSITVNYFVIVLLMQNPYRKKYCRTGAHDRTVCTVLQNSTRVFNRRPFQGWVFIFFVLDD